MKKAQSKKLSQKQLYQRRLFGFFVFVGVAVLVWGFGYSIRQTTPNITYQNPKIKLQFEPTNLIKIENANYELWQINRDSEISLGKFNFNDKGELVDNYGKVIQNNVFDLANYENDLITGFKITLEPNPDNDLEASSVVLLSGQNLQSDKMILDLAVNLSSSRGTYVLATPTDGSTYTRENSGIWFYQTKDNNEIASLSLPVLPDGWSWEARIKYQNQYLSCGKFSDPAVPDEANQFSYQENSLTFPGEDFLKKPVGNNSLIFPLVLNNGSTEVFIALEPDLGDVDPTGDDPFYIRFLSATIKKDAKIHTSYNLNFNSDLLPQAQIKLQ